jgi:hypothetical protein
MYPPVIPINPLLSIGISDTITPYTFDIYFLIRRSVGIFLQIGYQADGWEIEDRLDTGMVVAGGEGVGGPLAEWYVYISCLSTAYKTKGE